MDRPPLDVTRLRTLVRESWARVDVVDETGSTNADLLADPAAADRSVLAAEHQTSGRGRLDRTWTSPPRAGITVSVLFRPRPPIDSWGWLPLLAGLALAEAVDAAGVPSVLKWPNDLLAGPDERKLAGILAQSSGGAVVIGIGLNVSTTPDELPPDVAATSLGAQGADEVDRTALLAGILDRLDHWYGRWEAADAASLAAAYRARCATLGRRVAVTLAGGDSLSGEAVDVDERGRLSVRTESGVRTVVAGDVVHLRRV